MDRTTRRKIEHDDLAFVVRKEDVLPPPFRLRVKFLYIADLGFGVAWQAKQKAA